MTGGAEAADMRARQDACEVEAEAMPIPSRADALAYLADMIRELHHLAKRHGESEVAAQLREAYLLSERIRSEERLEG